TAAYRIKQEAMKPGSEPSGNAKPTGEFDSGDLATPQSEMRGMIERYTVDRGSLTRFYTVDTSTARYNRMKQFYTEWLAALARVNFDVMSEEGRIDYLLFKNLLDHELRQLDLRAKSLAEMASALPFAQTISDLEDARRRMEPVNPARTAALLTVLNKQIEETRKSVEAGLASGAKTEHETV